MIKIHRDNRVIFWLLIGGLVLNILWSLRLELQAKTITTIVEKYHLSLNNNKDELDGLETFKRSTDYIDIETNDKKTAIHYDDYGNRLEFRSDGSRISIGKISKKGGGFKGISLSSGSATKEEANIDLSSEGITLGVNDGSKPFHIRMGRKTGLIEIRSGDYRLRVGKRDNDVENISIAARQGGAIICSKKGTKIKSSASAGKEKAHIDLSSAGLIEIRSGDYRLRVGKRDNDVENISIAARHGGAVVCSKKGIKVKSSEKLLIEAKGDIDIKSTEGVVRINGKKIHMNK